LLDYYSYAQNKGTSYDVYNSHAIRLSDLQECAKLQGVTFQIGDILLVRIGWAERYLALDEHQRDAIPHRKEFKVSGLDPSPEMAKWLWNTGFSACASDAVALEVFPIQASSTGEGVNGLHLHEVMLGGWGMPIGTSDRVYFLYVELTF
jgi:hypothetical protein